MHLSYLLWVPLAAATVGLLAPRSASPYSLGPPPAPPPAALPPPGGGSRYAGVPGAAVACVLAVILVFRFDTGTAGLQFVTDESWITQPRLPTKTPLHG